MKSKETSKRIKKQPERMCAVCRGRFARKELLRLTALETGEWQLDPSSREEGRGLYLCHGSECLKKVLDGNKKLSFRVSAESRALLRDLVSEMPPPAEGRERMTDKIAGLVGLGVRAGKCSIGTDAVLEVIASGKARLILLSEDASAGTVKLVSGKASGGGLLPKSWGLKSDWGRRLGKRPVAAIAVNDQELARGIEKIMAAGRESAKKERTAEE